MKIFYKSNRFKGWLKPLATLILLLTLIISVNAQTTTLTISGVTASNKPYDGNNTATLNVSLAAIVEALDPVHPDVTLVTAGATGTFSDAAADIGKSITVSGFSLSGADAAHYSLTQPTGITANITPLAITITPTPGQTKVYGTSDPAFYAYTNTPLLGGDVFTGNIARAPGANVGVYEYNIGSLTAGSNYSLGIVAGASTFSITKATPVISWATPAAVCYGAILSGTQLNATSIPGTFEYSPADGTSLTVSPTVLGVIFTPTDLTNYTTATSTVSVVVNPAISNNTISTNLQNFQEICSGNTPLYVNGSLPTGGIGGFTYEWKDSVKTGTVTTLPGGSDINYVPSIARTDTIWYTRFVSSPGSQCPVSRSNKMIVRVVPTPNPVITGPIKVCGYNSAITYQTPNKPGYQWAWFVEGYDSDGIPVGNINVTPNGSSVNIFWSNSSYGRIRVKEYASSNSDCYTFTDWYSVFIVPTITNFNITGTQTICSGNTPIGITGSLSRANGGGYDSTLTSDYYNFALPLDKADDTVDYRRIYTFNWQSSTGGPSGPWTTILTDTSHSKLPNFGSLTATTWYRREVSTPASCKEFSNVIKVTVQPPVVNTLTLYAQEICSGQTPTQIVGNTATGGGGALDPLIPYVYQWQVYNTVTSTWDAIASSNTKNYSPGALTQTTKYRRYVTSGFCTNSYSSDYTVTVNPNITGSALVSQAINCNGGTGSVTLSVSSGTPPYTYNFNSSVVITSATTNTYTGVAAGTAYNWIITDSKSCESTYGQIDVVQPLALAATEVSASHVDVDCFGNSTGSVTVLATAGTGTAPYEYKKGVGGTYSATNTFGSLAQGSHTIYVKDANGCETSVDVTINQPAALAATEVSASHVDVDCFGNSTGSVTVLATAGTGTAPYEYKKGVGGTYSATNTFGSLAQGSYTIYVKDANGCETSVGVTINQPAALAATEVSASHVDVDCFGNSTGSVTVLATAGTGTAPYEYKKGVGGTYSATNTFGSLAQGSYTIYVKDANGCETSVGVTINQPAALAATEVSASHVDVDCFGNSTGSVTVLATAGTGTAPYEYKKGVGGTYSATNTFGSLAQGSYTIYVKDANGCETSVGVTINQPAALAASTSQTDVGCQGALTGSATITVTVGTGTSPYEYKKGVGGTYSATNTFGSLAVGSYTLTVKDNNGCILEKNVTIIEPIALAATEVSASHVDVDCFGNSTGSVTVLATAGTGTAPYEYKKGVGGTYSATNTFGSLAQGSHTIYVKDANGCEISVGVTINQPAALAATEVSASHVDVDCFGNSTGSVTVLATAGTGTAPYEYKKGVGGTYSATNTFGSLAQGSYTIYVKDANGCETSVGVTINQPAALAATEVSASHVDVDCFGNSTGSVTVLATAGTGTAPYEYKKGVGGTYSATNTFGSLAQGSYTIYVKDANGCETSVGVTINQPAALAATEVSASHVDVDCFGNSTGSVTVLATAGTGTAPYEYKKGVGGTYSATNTFGSLAQGSYTIYVKDANGCETSVGVTINQPAALAATEVSASHVDVDCFGNSTGSVTVLATAGTGTAPYEYKKGVGGTYSATNTFGSLAQGSYTIYVKDANGCETSVGVTINQPAALAATEVSASHVDVDCFGNSTGSVTVLATAGTGTAPYEYKKGVGGTYSATNTFGSLAQGSYTIYVKDANGCETSVGVTINQPAALAATEVSASHVDVDCFGNSTGSVTVLATAGTGTAPYEYKKGVGGTYSATNTFGSLAQGSYTIYVKDANGCETSVDVTINQPTALAATEVSASHVDVDCFGNSTGSVTVLATAGTGTAPYEYKKGVGGTYSATNTFGSLAQGSHTIYVKDANGCETSVGVTINQPNQLSVSITSYSDVNCQGGSDGSINISISGGTPVFDYAWTGPGTFSSSNDDLTGIAEGTYNITVTDDKGCVATNSQIISFVNPLPTIDFTGSETVSCAGSATSATDASTPTSGNYSYQWVVSGGIIISGANTSNIIVQWNSNCTHGEITLIKTDTATGCSFTQTLAGGVTIYPLPTPVIMGATAVTTSNNTEHYTITGGTNHLYSWSVIGGSLVSGQGTTEIVVDWGSCGSCTTGSVSVVETSTHGCIGTATINVSITGTTRKLYGTVTYDNRFYNTTTGQYDYIFTPLNNITIELVNNLTNLVVATTTTASGVMETPSDTTIVDGYYEFTNLIANGSYRLRASTTKAWGGVNATDALMIKRQSVGIVSLDSLSLLAANPNLTASVNATDALLVQLRTVHSINSFAAGDWLFGTAPITLTGNLQYDFRALATGDVNRSYVPEVGIGLAKAATYTNLYKDGIIKTNNVQEIELPIRLNEALSLGAVTLDLSYNNQLVDVVGVTSKLSGFEYNINNGKIMVAWSDVNGVSLNANDALVTLKVRAKADISSTSDLFSFSDNTEFADANGNVVYFSALKVNGIESDNRSNDISVYPNPFKNNAEIIYNMVESGSVKLALYNAVGQRMEVLVDEYKTAGNYKYSLNTSDLPSGVYSCEIIINGETSKYKKVIKLVKTN